MRKLLLPLVAVAASIGSVNAFAVEGLTANVAATNNYVWRGVSQTNDQAAVSGGLDYAAASGFYVGSWVSNVDFNDDTTAEVDLYAGYGWQSGEFEFDLGYLYYGYPGGDAIDFSEVYASVSWQVLTVGINVLADSDWNSDFGDDSYLYADLAFEISDGLELAFHYGLSEFDAGNDYSDYGVSLSKNGFTFSVTDVDDDAREEDVLIAISYTKEFNL